MQIRAVAFDIGQTLCYYPLPLNWSRLYRPAFEEIEKRHDTAWRKSTSRSLLVLAEKMGIPAEETAFVGDEIKDMQCAKGAGAKAVLINRTGETKDYGQDGEITDLREISRMI